MILGNDIEHLLLARRTGQVILSSNAHGITSCGVLTRLAELAFLTSAKLNEYAVVFSSLRATRCMRLRLRGTLGATSNYRSNVMHSGRGEQPRLKAKLKQHTFIRIGQVLRGLMLECDD
jgi:hypothetical protein